MQNKEKGKGIFYGALGATLWGITGVLSQYMFEYEHVSLNWLIGSKMLIAGLILTIFSLIKGGMRNLAVWHNKKDILQLFIFSFLGMVTMQYIYFAAVKAANASTATILQFLSPVLILIYSAVKYREKPRRAEILTIVVAMLGTYMIATKGNPTALAMSPKAFIYGLLSAFAAAAYVLLPSDLLKKYGASDIVGWSMIIGGLALNIVHPIWHQVPKLSTRGLIFYIIIVIFGTVIAYFLYLESLIYISATTAGLLDAFEPLSAALLSATFLHLHFNTFEVVGAILILSTVFIMALAKPKQLGEE